MGHTNKGLLELQEKAQAEMICFVAGTLIKTKDGSKAIEEIEVSPGVWIDPGF